MRQQDYILKTYVNDYVYYIILVFWRIYIFNSYKTFFQYTYFIIEISFALLYFVLSVYFIWFIRKNSLAKNFHNISSIKLFFENLIFCIFFFYLFDNNIILLITLLFISLILSVIINKKLSKNYTDKIPVFIDNKKYNIEENTWDVKNKFPMLVENSINSDSYKSILLIIIPIITIFSLITVRYFSNTIIPINLSFFCLLYIFQIIGIGRNFALVNIVKILELRKGKEIRIIGN